MSEWDKYEDESGKPSKPKRQGNPRHGYCDHRDSAGYYCSNPGSHSNSTVGGGPWKCEHHFFESRGSAPRVKRPGRYVDDMVDAIEMKLAESKKIIDKKNRNE